MRLFSENNEYKLYQGSMLDMLQVIDRCSIDSIVTDPPYEINFMDKSWDASGIAFQKDTWLKCFQVLKPGAYMLVFGGSRTFHRIACAIEDAGFEIRDIIMWLYGSGFPKSMNLGKSVEAKLTLGSANTQAFKDLSGTKIESGKWGISKASYDYGARPSDYSADGHLRTDKVDYVTAEGKRWDGWGTHLKPSYEPIIVAQKPCDGSITENVLKYGVGGINIDECRVEPTNELLGRNNHVNTYGGVALHESNTPGLNQSDKPDNGRFPANTILTYDDTDFEEVCGEMPYTKSNGGAKASMPDFRDVAIKNVVSGGVSKIGFNPGETCARKPSEYVSPSDSGSAARYFYCAKASNKDRDEGLDNLNLVRKCGYGYDKGLGEAGEGMFKERNTQKRNTHPTVKPTDLMQYLVRLVTPNGGTVLDPFNGSGSTGKACMYENVERDKDYTYIGIELDDYYALISKARIEFAQTGQLAVIHDTTTDQFQSNAVTRMKINKLF